MALSLNLHGYFIGRGAESKRYDIDSTYNKRSVESIYSFVNLLKAIPYVYLTNNIQEVTPEFGSISEIKLWFETDIENRPKLAEMTEDIISVNKSKSTIIIPNFSHIELPSANPKKSHSDLLIKISKRPIGIILLDHPDIEDLMSFTDDSIDVEDASTIVSAAVDGKQRLTNHIKGWKTLDNDKAKKLFGSKIQPDLFATKKMGKPDN